MKLENLTLKQYQIGALCLAGCLALAEFLSWWFS